MTNEEVIKLALEQGIEVKLAKRKSDVKEEGVHIIEPTLSDIIDGLKTAILMGFPAVYLHSKVGWPYAPYRIDKQC